MSSSSFLDFRYGISRKLSRKPASQFSIAKERQRSSVPRVFKPNVEEMKRVFDKFDANKDGKISREEYNLAVGAFGREKGKVEAFTGFDNDGFIDFEGFMKLHNMEGGVKTSDIQSAFRVFDLDGNGKISADELLEVFRRLGERSNLEACRKMVRSVDADGDGLIDMDEFMRMMTQTMTILA
ncbi:hypothetical protein RJ640_030435 [Escallonia rubra]|uniref:EF-hand domain-containing protein n=1 Tax=Escallonia rubra TaxID=112253 RepID=A0AA88QC23_9ASTE|nr:hypothetical protein RJ640_030435 [Escallonia rubra]